LKSLAGPRVLSYSQRVTGRDREGNPSRPGCGLCDRPFGFALHRLDIPGEDTVKKSQKDSFTFLDQEGYLEFRPTKKLRLRRRIMVGASTAGDYPNTETENPVHGKQKETEGRLF
jgi:hypothetical protein